MELCCMHLRSFRYSTVASLRTARVFQHLLDVVLLSAGERTTSYGLSPRLAGLLDAIQVWHLPVSGHPNNWRCGLFPNLLVSICPNTFISCCVPFYVVRQYSVLKQHAYMRVLIGNAAIVLRSRLKVRVLKENWDKKARVDDKGIILTNGDIENGRKAVQYQVTPAAKLTFSLPVLFRGEITIVSPALLDNESNLEFCHPSETRPWATAPGRH